MADEFPSALTVLALDSAGSACSTAVWIDGRIVARRFSEMEHGHAEALIPMVQAAMTEAGLDYADLDLIAAGTGPGSYTGVRVALAAARAIASAAGKPLSGVSNFEAIAAACAPQAPDLVAIESRRVDFYIQVFGRDGAADSPPTVIAESDLAALFAIGETVQIAGDAAERAAQTLRAAGFDARAHPNVRHADATTIAQLAAQRWRLEGKPRAAEPIYLRPPDARTVAERAAGRAAAEFVTATPSHGAVMAALQHKCFDERWSAEAMTTLLSQPGVAGVLLIAPDTQVPLGYGLMRAAAGEAEILTFGVDPRYRRSGLGRRILSDLIARAREAGAEAVFLEVADGNKAARALYDSTGFIQVGRRAGYYRGPRGIDDALTYRLDLASYRASN